MNSDKSSVSDLKAEGSDLLGNIEKAENAQLSQMTSNGNGG